MVSPMSSDYILAENSYKLGFSHICSGKWCSDFLQNKYNAQADYFQFPVDKDIYNVSKPKQNKIKTLYSLQNQKCLEDVMKSA